MIQINYKWLKNQLSCAYLSTKHVILVIYLDAFIATGAIDKLKFYSVR